MNITPIEAAKYLLSQDNFLLVTHRRPDGDTIGSAVALCLALKKAGKTACILKNTAVNALVDSLAESLVCEDATPNQIVVTLDTAAKDLMCDCAERLALNPQLSIDHHLSNTRYAELNCVLDRSATGEVVHEVIEAMGIQADREIARAIYVAISTDTGCFRYPNTTASTHRVAALCFDAGVEIETLNKALFETRSRACFALERLIYDGIEFYFDGRLALVTITLQMLEKTGASDNDTENLSALPRRIEGVEVGILIRENKDSYRVSVRTGDKINASEVCARFGGGGHKNAGGCSIKGELAEVKARLISTVSEYME